MEMTCYSYLRPRVMELVLNVEVNRTRRRPL
jgi:hypothetical protein